MIVSQMPNIRLKEGEEKNMKMKSHKVLSIILVMAVVFTGINFSAVKTYAGTKSSYMKSYNKLDKKCKKKFKKCRIFNVGKTCTKRYRR